VRTKHRVRRPEQRCNKLLTVLGKFNIVLFRAGRLMPDNAEPARPRLTFYEDEALSLSFKILVSRSPSIDQATRFSSA
jgi:hypothetical protein